MASLLALPLPVWQQWIIAIVAVVALGELASRVVATIRARASTTIYRFDASAPSLGAPGSAVGHDHHHEAPPPNLVMDDPTRPPAIADADGRPRIICPCCGYPTARDEFADGACIFCHWKDPQLDGMRQTDDYAAALAAAKDNLAQFGLADRESSGPPEAGQELRDELRRHFDYLMTSERSDAALVWSRIDELTAALTAH